MKTVTQANWVRGVNAVTGKATVVQGSVKRASNLIYTRRGSLITCDGTLKVSGNSLLWGATGAPGASNAPIAMLAATVGPSPSLPIALSITSAGALNIYDLTYPNVTSGLLINNWGGVSIIGVSDRLPQLLNVGGLVIGCIGNDVLPLWANLFNGVTGVVGSASDFTVAGAAHGCFHQGALWLWNTAAIDGVVDGPSTLRMCAIDASGNPDVTNFPRLNQYFVDRNDGTQGQGAVSFTSAEAGIAPTSTLVLFKDYSTYQVTGLLTPGGGVSVTRAQTDMGCVAPRTIQFAPGFGIVRFTHFGISVFNGADDKLISEEIRPYIFTTENDIQAMDWTRIAQCYATVTVNPPMYVVGVPMPGIGGLSRFFCYDLVIKQWSVIDLLPPSATTPGPVRVMTTMKLGSKKPITYLSDWQPLSGWPDFPAQNAEGFIRKWQDGDQSWDGTAISWAVKPPPVFAENPSKPLYFRRVNLRARTSNAMIAAAFDMDNVQAASLSVNKAFKYLRGESLYGSAHYGTGSIGTDHYNGGYPDLVIPFDIGAKSWSSSVQYSGSGPIELMATDWDVELKPSVPQPRVS